MKIYDIDKKPDSWDVVYRRLEEVARTTFGTLSAMATDMGKSPGTFSAYKAQKKPLGMKMILSLKNNYNINPDYLLFGEKPVFLKEFKLGYNEELAVLKRNIVRYKELKADDTRDKSWSDMVKTYGFSEDTSVIYKVIEDETSYYYTKKQFKALFKVL
jgi:hypothetical protein